MNSERNERGPHPAGQFKMYLGSLVSDRSGATAMMFALAFLPLMLMTGAAVDYARGINYKTRLKNATDAAVLAAAIVTGDPDDLNNTNLDPKRLVAAQGAFNAHLGYNTGLTSPAMTLTSIPDAVQVSATGSYSNVFGGLFGMATSNLAVVSEAAMSLKTPKMEIAFVLDSTGSMASNNKMPLLKVAMRKFLKKLQASNGTVGDVKVSLVPFDTVVRIDPVFAFGKPWMRQPIADLSGWAGCIMDRVQPYDTNATTPALIAPDTLLDAVDNNLVVFPNASPSPCNLAPIQPLTTNFTSFAAKVDAMSPNGQTNGTVGLAWGLQMLTPGDPFGTASAFGGGYRKVIVFLTDGANTKNRWSTSSVAIDARMLLACAEIKNKGVELFTIGLVSADMSILTPCATNPTMAYQVTDPNKIPDLFDVISQQFVATRLTK